MHAVFRITALRDERRSRRGQLIERVKRTAGADGITVRLESGLAHRLQWRSYRKATLRKLGEYPESGDSLWRLKLHRRLAPRRLLQNNISLAFACSEATARMILGRVTSWIRA
jgi:hypothetical protein